MLTQGGKNVTLIVPSYNASLYLAETLSSLLLQSYKNTEILVVDDGSTDNTFRIALRFQSQDSRVTVIQNPRNLGESAAINLGWAKATGELIGIVSSDDPQDSNWLSSMLSFIDHNPGYTHYYPDRKTIDGKGQLISVDYLYEWSREILIGKMICIASAGTLINRRVLPGDFVPRDVQLVQFSDLKQMLSLANYGEGRRVAGVYGIWRRHEKNLSYSVELTRKVNEFHNLATTWLDENYPKKKYPDLNSQAGIYMSLQITKWHFEQTGVIKSLWKLIQLRKLYSKLIFRTGILRSLSSLFWINFDVTQRQSISWFRKIPRKFS
jgi:glycosyltransferase involved in cell wall biosynthesis